MLSSPAFAHVSYNDSNTTLFLNDSANHTELNESMNAVIGIISALNSSMILQYVYTANDLQIKYTELDGKINDTKTLIAPAVDSYVSAMFFNFSVLNDSLSGSLAASANASASLETRFNSVTNDQLREMAQVKADISHNNEAADMKINLLGAALYDNIRDETGTSMLYIFLINTAMIACTGFYMIRKRPHAQAPANKEVRIVSGLSPIRTYIEDDSTIDNREKIKLLRDLKEAALKKKVHPLIKRDLLDKINRSEIMNIAELDRESAILEEVNKLGNKTA